MVLAFWITGFVGEWGLRIGLVWEKAGWGGSGPCWGVWGCFWVGSFLIWGARRQPCCLHLEGWLLLEARNGYGLEELWSWAGFSVLDLGSPVGSLGRLNLGCGEWVYPRLEGTRLGTSWEVV